MTDEDKIIPFADPREKAMEEVWELLRLSEERPLTREEHKRLRDAESRAHRRSK